MLSLKTGRNLHEILRQERLKYEMSRAHKFESTDGVGANIEEETSEKMIVDITEKSEKLVSHFGDVLSKRRSMLEVELRQQPLNSVRIASVSPSSACQPIFTSDLANTIKYYSFAGKQEDCNRWVNENPAIIARLPIPLQFWVTSTKDLNGCSNAIYNHHDDGTLASLDTWSCFKLKEAISKNEYVWHQMTMFIRWRPKEQNTFIFCSDLSESLQKALNHRISGIDPSDPYTWHAVFLDELRECYDDCVWKLRHLVREAEKFRDVYQPMGPDFPKLHDIARHVIHSNETLDVAIETIDSILHEHELLISREGSTGSHKIQKISAEDVTRRLYYHSREIRAIKARSASLYDRLQNEINLGFNSSHKLTQPQ
ncbi:conserved hypothetical protein [Histoplasma capsulatum G186AR]|uniref:Uncharacterized protein n=1 Tax=Ajellomyces capsulatus (strain G186AR / H82 / ATCC MYA-2454 / RMSCC 2432) TaxID=447093 RepID=C0NDV5_AJECG|nr:uncharacterized protein HCBG_02048 [Histoplasma capsulatum G186AR]EEH10403.1 conserved hypothetical protein [Histoplasma capsulatum G186AR]